MGAVLGIAAWGRTQEKVAGASTLPSSFVPSPSIVRQPILVRSEYLPGQSPKFTDD
jgi:hypothetical protein